LTHSLWDRLPKQARGLTHIAYLEGVADGLEVFRAGDQFFGGLVIEVIVDVVFVFFIFFILIVLIIIFFFVRLFSKEDMGSRKVRGWTFLAYFAHA